MRRPGIWVANGTPSDVSKMISWRPGALTGFYDHLGPNRVAAYKAQNPAIPVTIRFQHPPQWRQDTSYWARLLADAVVSKWPEIRDMDPYVYFCNELNLHYENGDGNVGSQPQYETPEFYQAYANWVRMTADRIKQRVPDMKLVCPPFAFGHHEDGAPDDTGNPKDGWAGYDYLAETVRSHFGNIITFHAYWGHAGGSVREWLYDATHSSWYAFRWRRVLKLFERRYNNNQVRVIIDEAGNFGAGDADFTDQVIYHARECLSDSRVIAVTYFLWEDPTRSPGNLPNSWVQRCRSLDDHIARLRAMPDVVPSPAPSPTPSPVPGGQTVRVLMPDGTVQTLAMEEYLRGVVPAEMPASWPLEALKVQAVAARSYATVATKRPRHGPNADVCTTTHCQVYNPARIKPSTDQAVQATRGQVILYQGEVATAYYSANCGGQTRGNETVWSGSPVPYLRPVPCINPGPKNGHGVGLCQWGAHDMAKRGDDYVTILKHYYTGVTLSGVPTPPAPTPPPTPTPTPTPPPATTGALIGVVRDQNNRALANVHLRLIRSGWSADTASAADGSYAFRDLVPGTYSLLVVDYTVRRDGLVVTAGQQLVVNLTLQFQPTPGKWKMEVERRPGLPLLAGSLPRAGIQVTLTMPSGNVLRTFSGTRTQYGPGGFEFWVPQPGVYRVQFLDQIFEVTVSAGQTTRLTFTETQPGTNRGVISGMLRNQAGHPQPGRTVTLNAPGVSRSTVTDVGGAFRFEGLAAGTYTLSVLGTSLSQSVVSDGQTPVTLNLVLQPTPGGQWLMRVARTPGPALIAGSLPEAGITLTITPPSGSAVQLVSGSKPIYGPGGFELAAPQRGVYTIQFLQQTFRLPMDGQYTRITFVRTGAMLAEVQVRLVSDKMPLSQAQATLQQLDSNAGTAGLFTMEQTP